METKNLTPHESLEIISNMIVERKARLNDNGIILRLWAWLVIAASIGMYVFAIFKLGSYAWTPWLLMPIGGIATIILVRKRRKTQRAKSFIDRISSLIWLIFGVNAFIIGIVFSFFWGFFITPIILLMLGIASTIDGVVLKFNPMIIGGILCILIAWFTFAWIMFLPHVSYSVLMNIPALILTNLIPGYILKAEFNKSKSHV
jgi:hypothetical protein